MKNLPKYIFVLLFTLSVSLLLISWFIQRTDQKNEKGDIIANKLTDRTAMDTSNTLAQKIIPPLTLESVFTSKIIENGTGITIVATGDVMLGRTVNYKTLQYNNFSWAFMNIASQLREANISIINLEGPLTNNCKVTNTGMRFCGDTGHIEGLMFSGVDIANLANNHGSDHGKDGLNTTKMLLTQKSIQFTGTKDQPIFESVKDTTFSFLGYNVIYPNKEYLMWGDKQKVITDIKQAKLQSDIVITSFHWGTEYTIKLTDRQINLAHASIDAGADIVIGHHPHWIQPIEIYKGKPIFYSLGNLVFDQMWSQKTREGLIVKIDIQQNEIANINLIPIIIDDYGQPRYTDEQEYSRIIGDLKTISKDLAVR